MNKKLEEILTQKYPSLYQDINGSKKNTIICWDFQCQNGWFPLIETLSELIMDCSINIRAKEVKKNRKRLYYYVTGYDPIDYPHIYGITNMAHILSEIICEKCSKKGDFFNTFKGAARCEQHSDFRNPVMNMEIKTNLPLKENNFGSMWHEMIVYLDNEIKMHQIYNNMPAGIFTKIEQLNGKLCISYEGGNEVTKGMITLIEAYSAKVDEETGHVLNL